MRAGPVPLRDRARSDAYPERVRALLRTAALAVAVVAALGGPQGALGAGALDTAVADLRATGVHVSTRALGEATEDARARLIEARADLADDRKDVAFVIAPGPVGSPGMTAYARRLHRSADLDGALLVTAPGRPVIVWGVEPRRPARAAIARSGANALPNPVDRLVTAAEAAVPVGPDPNGVREVLTLFLLAGLGAAWATAWGAHRTDRRRRTELTEARTHLRVWIDALRAQAMILSTTRRLTPPQRHDVDGVLALCSDTVTGVHTARTRDDVRSLEPRVRAGFAALSAVRGDDGEPPDPFEGLCATDPAHGRALPAAPTVDGEVAPALCRDCRRRAEAGEVPPVRMVPLGSAVVPYTALAAGDPPAGSGPGEAHSSR